jgi:hypothetical protein
MPIDARRLESEEIARLSSAYIDSGVKNETWSIKTVLIDGGNVRAELEMDSVFVSPTDPGGFHLSIFSTQEFLAQLSNIYLHLLAGSERKERETWMREVTIKTHKTIRDRNKILVEMDFFNVRRFGEGWYAMARCRVFDDHGGLFTAELKGMIG